MKDLTELLTPPYPKGIIGRFVIGYLLMQGNSLLAVLAVVLDWREWAILPLLGYLFVVLYLISRAGLNLSFKPSGRLLRLLLLSLIGMLLVTVFIQWVSQELLEYEVMTNQANVLNLFNNLSPITFVCYLLTASILEEVVYRGFLFGLSGLPWFDVLLTSAAFAVLHQPSSPILFLLYFSLGLFLGNARYRNGLAASIILHILWNMLVLIFLLL